ncbi:AAA family ATPase [Thalassomonas sp. RHCl1]|uniref:AAA family ATPase n=1 Tax=Thalassomonas sp. RHCl1 TaxID=2995320 RepID=UPI00248CEE90|nr:AAA family ATPase [Thalassomonas sp. RHCl1]
MNEVKVIAISGVSGSGKTSVIKQLSKEFSCPYLLFDDHTDENTYPNDMKLWFKHGADVSEIKTPKFIDSLRHLKAECDNEFIFIEEPFGRCRGSISSLVDYVILLDQPMEVCLSRVIMRHIKHPSGDPLNSIPGYLSMYDGYFREIYIESTNQVREDSDFIIQKVASIESTTKSISHWLKTNVI